MASAGDMQGRDGVAGGRAGAQLGGRGAQAEGAPADGAAPPVPRAPARRDPFAHGDLPVRPTYLPEEGEGGRSEIWSTFGGLVVAVAGIMAVAWLVAFLY